MSNRTNSAMSPEHFKVEVTDDVAKHDLRKIREASLVIETSPVLRIAKDRHGIAFQSYDHAAFMAFHLSQLQEIAGPDWEASIEVSAASFYRGELRYSACLLSNTDNAVGSGVTSTCQKDIVSAIQEVKAKLALKSHAPDSNAPV